MGDDVVGSALDILRAARRRSSSALVAFSGGKDSLAVLDLCLRTFERVECFHMWAIPGLRVTEEMLEENRKRFGVTIHLYPHWVVAKWLKLGVYCTTPVDVVVPEWKLKDIYAIARDDTGIDVVATGAKEKDSLWRRRFMSAGSTGGWDFLFYPLRKWSKFDVIGYLKARKIPVPKATEMAASASGIDLSTPSLLWLHDNYPDDFRRICEFFPFAEAVVHQRRFYSTPAQGEQETAAGY